MANESSPLTNWKEIEQQAEKNWIDENVDIFQELALSEFDEIGRGFVLVNASQASEEQGHPYGYFPQSVAEEMEDQILTKQIEAYDPLKTVIVLLDKGNGAYSIHLVDMQIAKT